MSKYKESRYTFISEAVCQIRYSSCNIYSRTLKFSNATGKEVAFDKKNVPSLTANFKGKKGYNGTVSSHVKKRISKAVDLFLQKSPKCILFNPVTKKSHPFQLSFITLTIANNERVITGREGYEKLLKPFLQWLTKTKSVHTFIWKAEMQKRGQLHYHITLNKFIHFKEIQEKWNYLQRKACLLDEYYLNNSHHNPNSTDVHSVKNIKNISGYLTKYLAKTGCNEPEEAMYNSKDVLLISEIYEGNILSNVPVQYFDKYEVGGKTWDCSEDLRGKKYFDVHIDDYVHTQLERLKSKPETRMYSNEFCTMFFSTDGCTMGLLSDIQLTNYKQHIYDEVL